MEAHTFGSDEGHEAILEKANVGVPYPFRMNMTDFEIFVTILRELALYGEVSRSARVAVAEILGTGTDDTEPIEDWAWGWYSGIADTLGVELV
jgi:hypothetical protein